VIIYYSGNCFSYRSDPENCLIKPRVMLSYFELRHDLHNQTKRFKRICKARKGKTVIIPAKARKKKRHKKEKTNGLF